MKNVLDTNPVITACISEGYKTKVIKYFQDRDSLMILTIYNEIKDNLLMFHMALVGLENFSLKGNKQLLLNLPIFKALKKASDQLYNFIKNSDDISESTKKLQSSVGVLLSKIGKIVLYPDNDKKKQKIINFAKKSLSSKLPKIKDNDLHHLYLMDDYTKNFASLINFYTEDKKDYLNNREKIGEVLKEIKIKNFSEFG